MIPNEQFLAVQPEHSEDDEKTLMFARINHELAEREALEQQRQGLVKKKQTLMAENTKRKEDLASLDQDLEKFIDVSVHTLTGLLYGSLMNVRRPNLFRRYLKSNINSILNQLYCQANIVHAFFF